MAKDDAPLPLPKGWEDNYELAFPKDYLGKQHLRGHQITVTIDHVDLPELTMISPGAPPTRARRLVVHLAELRGRTDGTPFKWIVNRTNAGTIASLYGKAAREWIGKRITLYEDKSVRNPKDRNNPGAIRVRDEVPPERNGGKEVPR